MPPKYPRLLVSEPTKADKGSNLRDPLYNSLFDLSALRLGYEIFAQQFVQKISAQVEFIPDDRFVIHFLFLHTLILNVQFSILFVNSTEICTLFSVQTVAALRDYRAVTLYFNSEFLRLFACKKCRICPASPTIGNISDRNRHYVIGLSPRHGSHAAAPTASNLWPDGSIIIPLCRLSRTDCHIGFGSCYLSLGFGSSFGIMLSRGSSGKVPCLSDL